MIQLAAASLRSVSHASWSCIPDLAHNHPAAGSVSPHKVGSLAMTDCGLTTVPGRHAPLVRVRVIPQVPSDFRPHMAEFQPFNREAGYEVAQPVAEFAAPAATARTSCSISAMIAAVSGLVDNQNLGSAQSPAALGLDVTSPATRLYSHANIAPQTAPSMIAYIVATITEPKPAGP